MPELSIIIPTLIQNKEDTPAVNELRKSEYEDYEILIQRTNNVSESRNKAVKRAKADKLIFLDDDSIIHEGYLSAASKSLENYDVIVGKTVHPGPENLIKRKANEVYFSGNELKEVEKLQGCNMGMSKELFEKIGGFDEGLPYGHEESELAYRLRKKGYKIYYIPEMVVDHWYAEDILDLYSKMVRHGKSDISYWKKKDERVRDNLRAIFPYSRDKTILGTLILSIGVLIKDIGRIKGYLDQNR